MKWGAPLTLILTSLVLGIYAPWRPEPASRNGPMVARADEAGCLPPRSVRRTFVGFNDGRQWVGDFEPAAVEATRIVQATRAQFCSLPQRGIARASAPEDLHAKPVEITAVLFGREDLAFADVQMRRIGREERRWSLRVVRASDGWQVVGARPR